MDIVRRLRLTLSAFIIYYLFIIIYYLLFIGVHGVNGVIRQNYSKWRKMA